MTSPVHLVEDADVAFDAVEVTATDGLENLATGQGRPNDSRAPKNRTFYQYDRSYYELLATYRSNWIAGQIVEIPAFEMTREGRRFKIEDPKTVDAIRSHAESLNLWEKVREAIQWSDLFGGGALLLGVDGLGDLDQPLDPTKIRPGMLKFVHSLDARSLIPEMAADAALVIDPSSPNFMSPEFYWLVSARNQRVHNSRIVRFSGMALPWLEMQRKLWWGGSRVERAFDAIADAETVIGGVAELVTEAKVDVYSIPGLMNLLSTPEGEAKVLKRVSLANSIKSNWQAVIKDAAEEYDQKQNAIVQGMGSLIEQYLVIISGASGIPVTKLLGTSAKGLSATGEGDLRNFYDMIAARQKNYLKPRLDLLDKVFLRSAVSDDPDSLPWEFNSLWQMDEGAAAELESKRAATAKLYFDMGVIDEVVIAKQLKQDGTYEAIDDEYIEDLEDLLENPPEPPPPMPGAVPPPGPAGSAKRDPAGNEIPPETEPAE